MDEEKVEAFNVFLVSVFNNTDRSWAVQFPEVEDHERRKENFPILDTEIVHHNYIFSSDD